MKNYGTVVVKSRWFEAEEKNQRIKFQEITLDGFLFYLHLCKQRMHRYDQKAYQIQTSISQLGKGTKYTSNRIFEMLLHLVKLKVIQIADHSRKDYYYDKEGKLKVKELLNITAFDVPQTQKVAGQETIKDKFIPIDLDLLEHYKSVGLKETCFPLYCLLRKLSNGIERKAFMNIKNMGEILNYDKTTVNNMIFEMNSKRVLCSLKRNNGNNTQRYEHHLLFSLEDKEIFEGNYLKKMDANGKRWAEGKLAKQKSNNSLDDELLKEMDDLDEIEDIEEDGHDANLEDDDEESEVA